ncbi:hypothetical protein GCM10010841_26220 [Deinococcus aerophilus]|uniref:Uncharacterized protein n=1 Tax=Deinococcus aerophilus TaxID=522488 RepID=A0ABQ2GXB2_9DEIO|nr:hypothetical protein GCM10010841_26220 [Deinococcus aerophilus]
MSQRWIRPHLSGRDPADRLRFDTVAGQGTTLDRSLDTGGDQGTCCEYIHPCRLPSPPAFPSCPRSGPGWGHDRVPGESVTTDLMEAGRRVYIHAAGTQAP